MSIEKITAESPEAQSANLKAENIALLRQLFPELVTEQQVDGVTQTVINQDVLKELVGDATATNGEEKYGLNWHGKRRARQIALTPSTGTLRPYPCPDESVDWDTTKNLMIEGDNLEVLKLLQKSYAGKVKLIYIDPPYNTGKDFVYPDNFQDNIKNYLELTGQIEGSAKITTNTDASGRFHTDWLNMIYPRLKLSRNLLQDDGFILISIDDVEAIRLKSICDEIFGEENFLTQFSWRTDGNFDNQAKIKICHEYILMYAKSIDSFPHPPVVDPSTPLTSKLFKPEIRNTIVKNGPKNPVSGITLPIGFPADFETGKILARDSSWPIYVDDACIVDGKLQNVITVKSGWSSKDLILDFINNNCQPIKDSKGQDTSFVIARSGAIEAIKMRSDYQSHVISVLNGFGGSQKATAQLNEIGAFFNGYPKPVELIRYFTQMTHDKNALCLDFFAGSGTTAQAVLEQNAADGGSRRFILVQIPEPLDPLNENQKQAADYCDKLGKSRNVSELTKERVRRVGLKIKPEGSLITADTGFRVFKLDTSNIRAWSPNRDDLAATLLDHLEHIESGRTDNDVLYELLLKLGLDLCVPIETRQIGDKTVHSIGSGVLLACLAETITEDEVEALALGIAAWRAEQNTAGDTTAVFRDSAFQNDVAKSNLAAILEQNGVKKVRSL